MKEKIKQAIADRILKQGQINLLMRNLSITDELTDEKLNTLIELKEKLEIEIQKLKKELKNY